MLRSEGRGGGGNGGDAPRDGWKGFIVDMRESAASGIWKGPG